MNLSRRTPKTLRLPLALAAAALLSLAACSDEGTVLVGEQAWVLAPSAEGASVGGMTVLNRTGEARTLAHVIASDFRRAAIRATARPGADPAPPPPVVAAARRRTVLPPEGAELVLLEPKRALRVGDATLLAFHFDDSQVVFARAEVLAAPPPAPGPAP